MKKIFLLNVFIGLVLVACTSRNNTNDSKESVDGLPLKQVINNKELANQHFYLSFTEQQETDTSIVYLVKSLFEDDTVGLQIEVNKDIQPGIDKDGKPTVDGFTQGNIRISSIGIESDNFLKALSSTFDIPSTNKMTEKSIIPTAFSSNSEVVDLNKPGTYRFKLFLDNSEGDPAEVFAVLDTYRKIFELSEKDSSYRKLLISAFEGYKL